MRIMVVVSGLEHVGKGQAARWYVIVRVLGVLITVHKLQNWILPLALAVSPLRTTCKNGGTENVIEATFRIPESWANEICSFPACSLLACWHLLGWSSEPQSDVRRISKLSFWFTPHGLEICHPYNDYHLFVANRRIPINKEQRLIWQ